MTIAVLGAGAFGSAIAVTLAKNRSQVYLWTRTKKHANDLEQQLENKKYLKSVRFPETLIPTNDLSLACRSSKAILLCIPTQNIYKFFSKNHSLLPKIPIVLCSKGIHEATSLLQSDIVKKFLPSNKIGVLTGPSFASEIARGLPTALTLACENQTLRQKLQNLIATPTLRIYSSNDIIGAQLGGSLKNIIAIACGMAKGAKLGESARIALMTRGFAEIVRLGTAMGSDPNTFYGLSGLGDLALTCNSTLSRNFCLGLNYSKNSINVPSLTIEGIKTASAAHKLAKILNIEVPIIKSVDLILKNKLTVKTAMVDLLSRPLKSEYLYTQISKD